MTSTKPLFRATKAKPDLGPALGLDLPVQRKEPDVRRDNDFYPTGQPDAIRGLLAKDGGHIARCGTVWENSCGDGALVREMRDAGLKVIASDLVDRGCPDSWLCDYFDVKTSPAPVWIANPPYNLINAKQGHGRWLRHAVDVGGWDYMAMLLSWDWPAAKINGLGELMESHPFSYCYLMRWKLDFTGEGSPPQRNAWFVWRRDWVGEPAFRFMDKVDNRQGQLFDGVAA